MMRWSRKLSGVMSVSWLTWASHAAIYSMGIRIATAVTLAQKMSVASNPDVSRHKMIINFPCSALIEWV